MSLLEPLTYDRLRWELTTRQLFKLVTFMKIDISDIPKNKKDRLAKRIWDNYSGNKESK